MMEQYILGVDVGGNHVKMGFVDPQGGLHEFQSFPTAEWRNQNFIQRLIDNIGFKLVGQRQVNKVGIGLPGTISKDRSTPVEITAIPELNGQPLLAMLQQAMPHVSFFLENDANAAAVGEALYVPEMAGKDFIFLTLGTGIGSAAVMDGRLIVGGDGNGLELGHIPSRNGRRLEENIGKAGIIAYATQKLAGWPGDTVIPRDQPLSASRMVVAAENKDQFSREVYAEIGEILGEGIVAVVRILDIKNIVIGGGLSSSFDFIMPGVMKSVNYYLTPYYLKDLKIIRAQLGNDAGLLGAAALCMQPAVLAGN